MPAGYASRAAFTREATIYAPAWPGAAAIPLLLLPLLSESVGPKTAKEGVVTVDSKGFTSRPIEVSRVVTGDISVATSYFGLEFFIAAAMGFQAPRLDGDPQPENLGGGLFRHLFEIDATLSSQTWLAGEGWIAGDSVLAGQQKLRRGTYTIDKTAAIWETLSGMLGGFQFQANSAACTLTSGLVGYDIAFDAETDLTGLLCPNEFLTFGQSVLYLGEAAPLDSSDIISDIVGFSVSLGSALGTVQTLETGNLIDEPSRVGPAIVSGSFALPFYRAVGPVLQAWTEAGTELYGLIEFTKGDFRLRFWLPKVILTSFEIGVAGPQQVQQHYQFVASPGATPSGFPVNVKNGPLMVEMVNETSAHALF